MSNESGSFSGTNGNYSYKSRLANVREKLAEINSQIGMLDSNMMFLLAHPFLVEIPQHSTVDNNDNHDGDEQNNNSNTPAQPVETPEYDGQAGYVTDRVQIHSELSKCLNTRYELLLEQKVLVEGFNEEEKQSGGKDKESINLTSIG